VKEGRNKSNKLTNKRMGGKKPRLGQNQPKFLERKNKSDNDWGFSCGRGAKTSKLIRENIRNCLV